MWWVTEDEVRRICQRRIDIDVCLRYRGLTLAGINACPAQERPTAAHWCFESPCQLSIQGDLSEFLNGPHFCGRDVDKVRRLGQWEWVCMTQMGFALTTIVPTAFLRLM